MKQYIPKYLFLHKSIRKDSRPDFRLKIDLYVIYKEMFGITLCIFYIIYIFKLIYINFNKNNNANISSFLTSALSLIIILHSFYVYRNKC